MVLVALTWALVGCGEVSGVKIDDKSQVWELKDAIWEKIKPKFIHDDKFRSVVASDLQLSLAKKPVEDEGGKEVVPVYRPSAEEMKEESIKWLPDEHRAALKLVKGESDDYINALTAGEPILGSKTLTTWFYKKDNMELPSNEQIHVLVVVPKDENDRSAAMALGVAPSLPPTTMHRHPERLKRWAAINAMIHQKNQEGNEKTSTRDTTKKRKNRDIDSSMPYSSLSWTDLEPILTMEDFNLEASAVPQSVVEQLHARLAELRKLYGDIYTGKEAKRQLFIVAVIEAVCLMLGDVTILVEEDVIGKNVRVHGRFEFVLKRGRKRISIVEAKRDDIPQGIAQNVAGLEALCDVEGLERTFGIVTNYLEWIFISDDDETIRRIDETLKVRRSMPSKESLKEILGMIYGMLSNSN